MAKLSKAVLAEHRAWLSEWRMPAEMSAYLSRVNNTMGPADFFGQGGVAFLRDAWLAAEFGRHRQGSLVQLVPETEQWPDFRARAGSVIEDVECVEADVPGRRRGDEYRDAARESKAGECTVKDDPEEDWIARAEQVPAALSAAIAKKASRLPRSFTGRPAVANPFGNG